MFKNNESINKFDIFENFRLTLLLTFKTSVRKTTSESIQFRINSQFPAKRIKKLIERSKTFALLSLLAVEVDFYSFTFNFLLTEIVGPGRCRVLFSIMCTISRNLFG